MCEIASGNQISYYGLPWGRLNIKMPSYQYRDPRVKYKTVSWSLIFNMEISVPGIDGLYI